MQGGKGKVRKGTGEDVKAMQLYCRQMASLRDKKQTVTYCDQNIDAYWILYYRSRRNINGHKYFPWGKASLVHQNWIIRVFEVELGLVVGIPLTL